MYSEYYDFLLNKTHNKWIVIEHHILKVYLRRARRRFNGVNIDTLDIANLIIADDRLKGNGVFTRFITMLENESMPLYVENVENIRLEKFLSKRGYISIHNEIYPHSGLISMLYTNKDKSDFKWD